jgi:hypothetical protein
MPTPSPILDAMEKASGVVGACVGALVGAAGDDGPSGVVFDGEEAVALGGTLDFNDVDVIGEVVTEVTIEETTC